MRLKGKTALVTGGARGIGAGIATAFAAQGAAVMIADKDGATAAATARSLVHHGGQAESVIADVSVPTDCTRAVAACVETLGGLDVLVNNAGIGFYKLFLDLNVEDWERVLRVNLTSAFLVGQAAARHMSASDGGRIINIASISGQTGGIGRTAYGASKAGMILMTKVMAVELAAAGIVVNAIAPGPIHTELTKQLGGDETRRYVERIPMGRYGKVEDIAAAALFLASDECRFVTGHVLNIDGGFDPAGLMFDQSELAS